MSNCCCESTFATIAAALAEECVCLAPLGAVIALTNGDIYRRTAITVPCNVADFTLENISGGGGSFSFDITDGTNTETVSDTQTLTFIGQNGISAVVSPVDTVTFDGLTTENIVAPVAAPAVPTQPNLWYNRLTNILYIWDTVALVWKVLINGAAGTGSPLPVASFQLTKRALTASLDASSSTSTQVGITLTYQWTSTPAVGVVFSNPVGVTTDVTFPSPGLYTITLTVTDTLLSTESISHVVAVDRILHVKGLGIDEAGFETLQAASTWIQTNDLANAHLYTIKIWSLTDDAVAITLANRAKLDYRPGGQTVSRLLLTGAGEYIISGSGLEWQAIQDTLGSNVIVLSTGTSLSISNIRVHSVGAGYCIESPLDNSTIKIKNVKLTGARGIIAQPPGVPVTPVSFEIDALFLETTGIGILLDKSATLYLKNSYLHTNNITLHVVSGFPRVSNTYFSSTVPANTSVVHLQSGTSLFTESVFQITDATVTSTQSAALRIDGAATAAQINQCLAYGEQAQGLLLIDTVTPASLKLYKCTFVGNVAGKAIRTAGFAASSILLLPMADCVIQTTIIGAFTYAAVTLLAAANVQV